jgi:hypothetical protein
MQYAERGLTCLSADPPLTRWSLEYGSDQWLLVAAIYADDETVTFRIVEPSPTHGLPTLTSPGVSMSVDLSIKRDNLRSRRELPEWEGWPAEILDLIPDESFLTVAQEFDKRRESRMQPHQAGLDGRGSLSTTVPSASIVSCQSMSSRAEPSSPDTSSAPNSRGS